MPRRCSLVLFLACGCGGQTSLLARVLQGSAPSATAAQIDFTVERKGSVRTSSATAVLLPYRLRVLLPDEPSDVRVTALVHFADATSTSLSGSKSVVPFQEVVLDLVLGAAAADLAGLDLTGVDQAGDQAPSCGAGCVPAPPLGNGTLGILLTQTMGPCPAGYGAPQTFHANLRDPCDPNGCSCGTPAGPCDAVANLYGAAGCGNFLYARVIGTMQCNTISNMPKSAIISNAANPGTCAPVGTPAPSTPTWQKDYTFCPGPTGLPGCAASSVCLPGSDSFPAQCVAVTTGTPCPAQYPTRTTLATDFVDGRNCLCECSAPSGSSCTGVMVQFYSGGCSTSPLVTYGVSASCALLPAGIDTASAMGGAASGGSCISNANSVPKATPTGQTDFCCRGAIP